MNKRHAMFWGPSGAGKTTAIIEMLLDFLATYPDKIARVYVGDGSKASYLDTGLVQSPDNPNGRIQLLDYSTRDWPLTTMQDICEGKFPKDPFDPTSPLVSPTPEEFAKIGFWVFEGLSTASQYIMGDKKGGLSEQSARGVKIGQDSPIRITDAETDSKGNYIPNTGSGYVFGGNPMAHYNFAQRRVLGWIERTKALPGWVIWTAHERAAEEGGTTGEKLIGPEAAGKALTAGLSKYFSETLHFTIALGSKNQVDKVTEKNVKLSTLDYRIYTRDHYDPDGMTGLVYRAVNRCMIPSMMPDFLSGKEPGENIRRFYTILKEAADKKVKKILDTPS